MMVAIKKILLMIAFASTISSGRTQDSLAHKSIIVYQFRKLNIILVNQSMTDSPLSVSPRYIRFPLKENVFEVYGPHLRIMLTSVKEPLKTPIEHMVVDTSATDGELMKLEDLELSASFNANEHFEEWKDVNQFYPHKNDTAISLHFSRGTVPLAKGLFYVPIEMMVLAYDVMKVTIRNKHTKEALIHFRFKGIGVSVRPFLSLWTQDKQGKNLIDSFVENETPKMVMLTPDARYSQDYSKLLKDENLQGSSDLMLYFRKAGSEYPDSSMEYRLLSETSHAAWQKTGHRLIIRELKPGQHYKLQIRYIFHPDYMQEHSFYIVPKWYQTTETKIISGFFLLLIVLFSWLLVYRKKVKRIQVRREQLSFEIKSIRSQLNPHFVFNALSSIQGLINKNDIAAANHYLAEFSHLLRESLRNNDKEMVPLVTEIVLLETYLKLEQLRFHFQYEIKTDQRINKNSTEVPSLLLQPLVENAIKHGVSTLAGKGVIVIEFIKKDNDLLVSVADNGKGLVETTPGNGFGLKLTRDRILLLNQTSKSQSIQLNIESTQNTGTTVHLAFKNWL
jgi:two-component sensor histidine kinase